MGIHSQQGKLFAPSRRELGRLQRVLLRGISVRGQPQFQTALRSQALTTPDHLCGAYIGSFALCSSHSTRGSCRAPV